MNEIAQFEKKNAKPYGYDLATAACHCCTYSASGTEQRWLGWQACAESKQAELDKLSSDLEATRNRCVEWATSKGTILRMYEDTLAELDKANARIAQLEEALDKIDSLRIHIINTQSIGWSKHVYPLVAILDEVIAKHPDTWLLEHDKAVEARVLEDAALRFESFGGWLRDVYRNDCR